LCRKGFYGCVGGWSTPENERDPHWQCGGQGFESPQLHPDDLAVSHFGRRPESCLVPFWWPLVSVRTPEGGPHTVGGLAGEGGHDVAVDVGGRAHLGVSEQFHDDSRMHSDGRSRVAAVWRRHADGPLDACRGEEGSPVLPVGTAVERAPVGLGEDEVLSLPLTAGGLTLPVLHLSLETQPSTSRAGRASVRRLRADLGSSNTSP
jgi:hypothetical protein